MPAPEINKSTLKSKKTYQFLPVPSRAESQPARCLARSPGKQDAVQWLVHKLVGKHLAKVKGRNPCCRELSR